MGKIGARGHSVIQCSSREGKQQLLAFIFLIYGIVGMLDRVNLYFANVINYIFVCSKFCVVCVRGCGCS
jgi:hypothetical protein